jgi:hypothetical protein
MLGALACQKPRVCPPGYRESPVAADAVWCRAPGGREASYYQFHPGTRLKRQSCPFVAGLREGQFEGWHPDSKRWLVGRYERGKLEGKWQQWSETGSKVADGEYREGRLVAGAPVAVAAICEQVEP